MAKPKSEVKEVEIEPLRKAFSIDRVEGGWQFLNITYQGNHIIDIERSQPDLKVVAIERFKIASLKYWSTIG